MKKLFFALALLLSQLSYSQTDEQIQEYGKTVYTEIIDTNRLTTVAFVRTRQYHELIDLQEASNSQKSVMKHRINETIQDLNREFNQSLEYLWEEYTRERQSGAEMSYLSTQWEPLDNTKYAYTIRVNFNYKSEKVDTEVGLIFDVAWLQDHFVILGKIQEDF